MIQVPVAFSKFRLNITWTTVLLFFKADIHPHPSSAFATLHHWKWLLPLARVNMSVLLKMYLSGFCDCPEERTGMFISCQPFCKSLDESIP